MATVTPCELDILVAKCRTLPPAQGMYLEHDYVTNLFLTVLDFQMHRRAVENAAAHYRRKLWDQVRTFEDLDRLLRRYPDDKAGNTEVAVHLWGYCLWTRVALLRKLLQYFDSNGIRTQEALARWARTSDYVLDFAGKVPGMGYAIYQWLVMRQGVETVKPDVHLRRFVSAALGREVGDRGIVESLEEVAWRLGLKAYELDWRIWEHEQGAAPAAAA